MEQVGGGHAGRHGSCGVEVERDRVEIFKSISKIRHLTAVS